MVYRHPLSSIQHRLEDPGIFCTIFIIEPLLEITSHPVCLAGCMQPPPGNGHLETFHFCFEPMDLVANPKPDFSISNPNRKNLHGTRSCRFNNNLTHDFFFGGGGTFLLAPPKKSGFLGILATVGFFEIPLATPVGMFLKHCE